MLEKLEENQKNLKERAFITSITTPSSTVNSDEEHQKLDVKLPPTEDVLDKVEEAKDKNLTDKSALVSGVVPEHTEQGIEVVRQVVPSVVLSAVPSGKDNITTPVASGKDDISNSINWQSYPYDSKDTYTLKNRAHKVKERILGCSTSNELNKLLFLGKVTEIESNWLVDNYFTYTENLRFRQIRSATQGNLFSASSEESESVIELEFAEMIEVIDKEMNRLGWSVSDGKQYLMETYGKKSRRKLSDEELLEFWDYLKSLPTSLHEEE